MNEDVLADIQNHADCWGHYHTGGVPGRNEIDGTQTLDYPKIMRAIVATGYQGYVGQEFVPKRPDALKSLQQAVTICDVLAAGTFPDTEEVEAVAAPPRLPLFPVSQRKGDSPLVKRFLAPATSPVAVAGASPSATHAALLRGHGLTHRSIGRVHGRIGIRSIAAPVAAHAAITTAPAWGRLTGRTATAAAIAGRHRATRVAAPVAGRATTAAPSVRAATAAPVPPSCRCRIGHHHPRHQQHRRQHEYPSHDTSSLEKRVTYGNRANRANATHGNSSHPGLAGKVPRFFPRKVPTKRRGQC